MHGGNGEHGDRGALALIIWGCVVCLVWRAHAPGTVTEHGRFDSYGTPDANDRESIYRSFLRG